MEDLQEELPLRQAIENRAALKTRVWDLESMGQAKFSKMNDLLDEARLELEEEAERAKLCLKGKRERKEEEGGGRWGRGGACTPIVNPDS